MPSFSPEGTEQCGHHQHAEAVGAEYAGKPHILVSGMSATDSNRDFRQRLLDLIDGSGVSDRRISMLATGNTDTVRNLRRGATPRLDSLEAVCRALGYRLEMVPLDEPGKPLEKCPEWAARLREEIRRDLIEALGKIGTGDPWSNRAE